MTKAAPKSITPKQPWIEAFRAGTHVDANGVEHEYSDDDIETLAGNINVQVAGGFVPPIVAGHPKTDSPRQGGIFEAKTDGASPRRLFLRADEVVPAFADAVQQGEYKYVSVALYPGMSGLRHLGVLGAVNPAVKGMSPLEFGEGMFAESDKGLKPEEIVSFAEPWEQMSAIISAFRTLSWRIQDIGSILSGIRDDMIAKAGDTEAVNKAIPKPRLDALTSFSMDEILSVLTHQPDPNDFSEPGSGQAKQDGVSPSEPAPAASSLPDAAGGTADDEAQAEISRLKRANSAAAFREHCKKLEATGRLLPAQKASVEELFNRLSNANEGAIYSETEPAFAPLNSLLESMPKAVEYGEAKLSPSTSTKNPLIADAERRKKGC